MTQAQPVLVYGATGAQGEPVARRLLAAGRQVRVVVRDVAKAEGLRQAGAEVVAGHFEDPASLRRASSGVSAVFLHLPVALAEAYSRFGQVALAAAEAAEVPHLVFSTSGTAPDSPTPIAEIEAKRQMVDRLLRSSVPTVVLKPGLFLENLSAPWSLPQVLHEGLLLYPLPADMRVSWISHDDVAAAAVAALARTDLVGRVFDLGGPAPLSGDEVAAGFAQAFGRPVRYVALEPAAFADGLRPFMGDGVADYLDATYTWSAAAGRSSFQVPDIATTAAILGYTPTALDAWVRAVAAATPGVGTAA